MGLKRLAAKLANYQERLAEGKASKIKPDHVQTVLQKLQAREADLIRAVDDAMHSDKRERLERKLAIAREQIERATWLLQQIS